MARSNSINWPDFSPQTRSPWRSGSGAGKGRRACNYVSGIWVSASKKSMRNADCPRRWHQYWRHYPWRVLLRAFQCLCTFGLVSASRWLAEIWQFSRRGATGELEAEFKFQRRCCKLTPSFSRPAARFLRGASLLQLVILSNITIKHRKHRDRFPGSVVTISKHRNIFSESNLIRIFLSWVTVFFIFVLFCFFPILLLLQIVILFVAYIYCYWFRY